MIYCNIFCYVEIVISLYHRYTYKKKCTSVAQDNYVKLQKYSMQSSYVLCLVQLLPQRVVQSSTVVTLCLSTTRNSETSIYPT